MIERTLKTKIRDLAGQFPIVTLTGPRQSGKSTLLRHAFPDYRYVSLEDLDMREFAETDPRGFLRTYDDRTIIDEAQRVPSLFSYLQTHVDLAGREGMYLLSGSHNFLLAEGVNQSLAGRAAVLKLLPFSHCEMEAGGILPSSLNDEIFMGAYPRIFDKHIAPEDYYPFYIQTYVERDVRTILKIGDLGRFMIFIRLCAGRIGQLLNLSSLANECGISVSTASAWLSVLEASYICYLLRPSAVNFSKRLVKTPKLYFYDTGLACSLLGVHSAEQLGTHFLRGGLFENLVINAFVKNSWNKGREGERYFWRDSRGTEVDLLCCDAASTRAYEIKSGATFSQNYFKGLHNWAALSETPAEQLHVIYGGETSMTTSQGHLVAWRDVCKALEV